MKLPLPRTTFGLVALSSVVLGLAALVLGAIVLFVSHEALEEQLDRRGATETRALVHVFNVGGRQAVADSVRLRASSDPYDLVYLLADPSGRKLAGDLQGPAPAPGWQEFQPLPPRPGERGVAYAQAITTVLPDGSRLVVAAPRRALNEADGAIARLVALTFGGMLLVGIGAAWGLRSVIRRRLDGVNATAHAIIDGDLGRRIPRDGRDDEFDRLAATLNRMLDRNGELLDNLRQVSNDIAHDLRTPMARQLQVLEQALEGERDPAAYREAIARAADGGREMLDLFTALLRISEIESFDLRGSFVPVDLAEVVDRVAQAFEPDVAAGGRRLVVDVARPAVVAGDKRLLSQMFANLVENGLRHTPVGAVITVALAPRDGQVVLSVADTGPGIPAEDRDRVLKRFARLEQSRSAPGFGLGLSVAQAIARAHFTTLRLGDAEPGLKVEIAFPKPA